MQVTCRLPHGAEALAVSGRPFSGDRGIGGQAGALLALTVRYAMPNGEVGRLRTRVRVHGADPAGFSPSGWAQDGDLLHVTLADAPGAGEPAAVQDAFSLPLQAAGFAPAGVTPVAVGLQATCRGRRGVLYCCGRLQLTAGTHLLDLPFCRVVEAAGAPAWEGWAVVGGLRLAAEPGGLTGTARIEWMARPAPHTSLPPAVARVREVTARVGSVEAELIAPGSILVRGTCCIDLFWFDTEGASRWTGVREPFSAVLPVVGAAPGDRLEPAAAVTALHHSVRNGAVQITAGICASCLVVRREQADRWLLDRIVGRAEAPVDLEAVVAPGGEAAGAACSAGAAPLSVFPVVGSHEAAAPADEGWRRLGVELARPAVDPDGRWRARAAVEGARAAVEGAPAGGENGGPAEVTVTGRADVAPGAGLTGLAGLVSLGPRRLEAAAVLSWGGPRPVRAPSGEPVEAWADLPAPARAVLGARVARSGRSLLVEALVALPGGRLFRAAATIAAPTGRPAALLAAAAGRRLRFVVELASP